MIWRTEGGEKGSLEVLAKVVHFVGHTPRRLGH
jgi:hypothetical protein